ncbi:MAG: transaldolase family protein [Saccharofermentanales bacterium]
MGTSVRHGQSEQGYDAEYMIKARLGNVLLAPNISVKIPVTHAGLIAIEELTSRGVHVTRTVGYSVAQGMQMAAAHDRGVKRAICNGVKPMGANFALFTIRLKPMGA